MNGKERYRLIILLVLSVIISIFLYCTFFDESIVVPNKKNIEIEAKVPVLDKNGNVVSKELYQKVIPFGSDCYKVWKNGRVGILNKNGRIIVPVKYDSVLKNYNYYIAVIKNKSNPLLENLIRQELYGMNGKKIFSGDYSAIVIDRNRIRLHRKGIYSFYDEKTKKHLFDLKSENPPICIKDDIYAVMQNNKLIIVNEKGKKIIKDDYEYLGSSKYKPAIRYEDKILFRIKKNGKWGIIDINGNEIIPVVYDEIITSGKDIIYAKKDGKWGSINYKNEILNDFIFNYIPQPLGNSLYLLMVKELDSDRKKEMELDKKIQIKSELENKLNKLKQKKIKKVNGDLHIVSVYGGINQTKVYFQKHKIDDVTVKVEIKNKPITLFLTSYEPVRWNIKTVPNSQIKKIYFSGYYDGDIVLPSKNIPVEKLDGIYFSREEVDKIKDYMNKPALTFQYKNKNDYFFVDGNEGSHYNNQTKHFSTGDDVVMICKDKHACTVSEDGLEVGYGNVGPSSLSKSNKYYSKGKYYFEAQIESFYEKIDGFVNMGIISDGVPYCDFDSSKSEGNCNAYGIFLYSNQSRAQNNDIFGYAVDFDNGKIYVSKNGNWIIGLPDKEKTYYTFNNEGKEYTAAVEMSKDIKWKLNFGKEEFKYPVPKGFLPYDTKYAEKLNQ